MCGHNDGGVVQPGLDAWIVGNEPLVSIDFTGMKEYAKKQRE